MSDCVIRPATRDDRQAAYHVCLKTGNYGEDGEPYYADDPDAFAKMLGDDGRPITDYGEVCARYYEEIAADMDAAGTLPKP